MSLSFDTPQNISKIPYTINYVPCYVLIVNITIGFIGINVICIGCKFHVYFVRANRPRFASPISSTGQRLSSTHSYVLATCAAIVGGTLLIGQGTCKVGGKVLHIQSFTMDISGTIRPRGAPTRSYNVWYFGCWRKRLTPVTVRPSYQCRLCI